MSQSRRGILIFAFLTLALITQINLCSTWGQIKAPDSMVEEAEAKFSPDSVEAMLFLPVLEMAHPVAGYQAQIALGGVKMRLWWLVWFNTLAGLMAVLTLFRFTSVPHGILIAPYFLTFLALVWLFMNILLNGQLYLAGYIALACSLAGLLATLQMPPSDETQPSSTPLSPATAG